MFQALLLAYSIIAPTVNCPNYKFKWDATDANERGVKGRVTSNMPLYLEVSQ